MLDYRDTARGHHVVAPPAPDRADQVRRADEGAEVCRADWYDDDPNFDYRAYWLGRDYEHEAERLAIRRLLAGSHVGQAVDVGGGFGRHTRLLAEFADSVTLAEPSSHQLQLAAKFLHGTSVQLQQSAAASLAVPDAAVDLIMMARVMHHLPDPTRAFAEFARVLRPDGVLVLEFANSRNGLNRLRWAVRGRAVPDQPVRPPHRATDDWEIPFVNHSPYRVLRQLSDAGFECEAALSVSNLRSAVVKRVLPVNTMLTLERILQPRLAGSWFGPSIWLRLRRTLASASHDYRSRS